MRNLRCLIMVIVKAQLQTSENSIRMAMPFGGFEGKPLACSFERGRGGYNLHLPDGSFRSKAIRQKRVAFFVSRVAVSVQSKSTVAHKE